MDLGLLLLYALLWVLWPLVFGAVAGRLLGIAISRVRGVASGLAGVGVGALVGDAVADGSDPAKHFVVFVCLGVLGTLACVALLEFLARPARFGRLERSITSIPHPLRAARRRPPGRDATPASSSLPVATTCFPH